MVVFAGLIAVALFLAAAWASGVFQKKTRADIAPALRQLLLEKNKGALSQEAFEQAQAALYDQLLTEVPVKNTDPNAKARVWVLAGGGVVALVVAVVSWSTAKDTAPTATWSSGAPAFGTAPTQAPGAPNAAADAPKGGDLNTLVTGLAQKMEKDPGNGQGWLLLARTYGELRQYANAANAYERAMALIPAEAQVLSDWADAHVMAHDRQWDDKARDIVKRAIKADPKNAKALTLAGSEAFDRKQYKAAIDFWKRSIAVEPPNSMNAKLAESNIQEATDLMNGKKPASAAETSAPASGAPAVGAEGADGRLKWNPAK